MIPIEMALGCLLLIGAACYCIGFRHGHDMGEDTGWDAGYAFRDTASEIRWQLTASGEQALKDLKIEVGTGLSPRSPLRTGRADLPHPALQSVVFSVTEAREFCFSGV